MNARQRKKLDAFLKAITFAETAPPAMASAPAGFAAQVQRLRDVVATIEQLAPDRGSGRPAKTAAQRAVLREALRRGQLQPLRTVARVLGKQVSGLPHLVNVKKSAGTQRLLDAARAALRDLAPYQEQFVAQGVAADFLDRLDASVQALEAASTAHVTASMARAGARGALGKAFQDGTDVLLLLDGIIRHACNADPVHGAATLAAWNTVVPPRGRANRTPTNVVSGTAADVTSGAGEGGSMAS